MESEGVVIVDGCEASQVARAPTHIHAAKVIREEKMKHKMETFVVGGKTLHEGAPVTRESFEALVEGLKSDCQCVAQKLLDELIARFPSHGVMDALGVVYPQYWVQGYCEISFRKHLDVLKDFYGEPKWVGVGDARKLIPPVLDRFKLELEQPLFKLAMKSNAQVAMELPPLGNVVEFVNPLTKIWRTLDANTTLAQKIGEYVKLAEIAMIHVLGSVEDERIFSSLTFLKDRLRNRLDNHFSVVVGMHAQQVYNLKTFPYDDCFKQWVSSLERHRYGTMA